MRIETGRQGDWNLLVATTEGVYNLGVLNFARDWGDLMEQRLGVGLTLNADVIRNTLIEVNDNYDATKEMMGAARELLVGYWRHGGLSRYWRRSRTNIPNFQLRASQSYKRRISTRRRFNYHRVWRSQ